MGDKVKTLAVKVARKADRVVKTMNQRIALLEWESRLLRSTVGYAADLLRRSAPKTKKRGDVWKRAHVLRIARIFAPAPGDHGGDGGGDGREGT